MFNEFLRFTKSFLSYDKADQANNPSLKSCLLRSPSTINSKYHNEVTTIQKWDVCRPRVRLLLGDFFAYLVDHKIRRQRELRKFNRLRNNINTNTNTIPWIEKLLETPIEDGRKMTINLILS